MNIKKYITKEINVKFDYKPLLPIPKTKPKEKISIEDNDK